MYVRITITVHALMHMYINLFIEDMVTLRRQAGSRRGKLRLFCAKVQCLAILSNSRQWQKDRADSPELAPFIVSAEFVSLEICWVHPQLTLYSHSCIYVCMYVCSVCVCMCVCVYVCKYPSMQSLSLALADAVQSFLYTCIVCMHACTYVYIVCMYSMYCMYPCMCISVFLYIYV
jgi:hypothetical protein